MYRWFPIHFLLFLLGPTTVLSAQPLLYLGVQGGTAVPDLRPSSADVALVSETGSGRSLGLFLRYGRRPYYQLDINWMRGQRSFLVDLGPQGWLMENIPVRQFGMGTKLGYYWLRTPYIRGRIDTGPHLARTVLLASPSLGSSSWQNAQWSWQIGTGVDVLYFNLDLIYRRGLGRLRPDSNTGAALDRLHMNVLLLLVGVHL